MKPLLLFIISILLFSSCQQIDLEFSCDPIINSFVKENQEEFSILTIEEFLTFNLPLQKAIYNSWDPWKKREVWIEKLERVALSDTFTAEEHKYIQQLIEHIHSNYYLLNILESEKDIRTQFAIQWIDEVKQNLEWTEKYIAFLIFRLYTDEYQFENELSELMIIEKSVNTSSECTCNYSADFCELANCIQGGCDIGKGCGWLWSMECNGVCDY